MVLDYAVGKIVIRGRHGQGSMYIASTGTRLLSSDLEVPSWLHQRALALEECSGPAPGISTTPHWHLSIFSISRVRPVNSVLRTGKRLAALLGGLSAVW